MADGAALAAAIGEGPLPVGKAALILAGVVTVGVGAIYWDDIVDKWDGIKAAFVTAFSGVATQVQDALEELGAKIAEKLLNKGLAYRYTASATNHLSRTCLRSIVENRSYLHAYWGTKDVRVIMLTFEAPNIDCEIWNDLRDNYYTAGRWERTQHNIGGATLLVVYDMLKRQFFHAHLRGDPILAREDIEWHRYRNKFTWELFPLPLKYDSKYLGPEPPKPQPRTQF